MPLEDSEPSTSLDGEADELFERLEEMMRTVAEDRIHLERIRAAVFRRFAGPILDALEDFFAASEAKGNEVDAIRKVVLRKLAVEVYEGGVGTPGYASVVGKFIELLNSVGGGVNLDDELARLLGSTPISDSAQP